MIVWECIESLDRMTSPRIIEAMSFQVGIFRLFFFKKIMHSFIFFYDTTWALCEKATSKGNFESVDS